MSSPVGRAFSVGIMTVTFRSLHFLHPESDFCTGLRLRLAGRALATVATDNGWPVWGAKSVDMTAALPAQCHRRVVRIDLMRVLSLLDGDRVECGAGRRLMYWKCKRDDLVSNSDKRPSESFASKAGSLSQALPLIMWPAGRVHLISLTTAIRF